VQGNDLECPFHAWQYNGKGKSTRIPMRRSSRRRRSAVASKPWRLVERNRFIWAWYHPQDAEPSFDVEALPEAASTEWSDYEKHEWLVYGPLQNMAENGVDAAHFRYIHGTASMPNYDVKFEGIRRVRIGGGEDDDAARRRRRHDFVRHRSVRGQAWTRFTGICETLMVAGITPVGTRLHPCALRVHATEVRASMVRQRAWRARWSRISAGSSIRTRWSGTARGTRPMHCSATVTARSPRSASITASSTPNWRRK
jgi:phenylpropionate dioxygenase-like ring-hydroxylating dioxygenase large terminal subunit